MFAVLLDPMLDTCDPSGDTLQALASGGLSSMGHRFQKAAIGSDKCYRNTEQKHLSTEGPRGLPGLQS